MTRGYTAPAGGECSACGKRLYANKDSAKRAIRGFRGRVGKLRPYRCVAGLWHIGHAPPANVRGDIRRDQIPPALHPKHRPNPQQRRRQHR